MVAESALAEEDRLALKKTGVTSEAFDPGNQFTPKRMGVSGYVRLQVPTSIAAMDEILATLDDMRERLAGLKRENITSEWRYGYRLSDIVALANLRLKLGRKQK